MLMHLLAGHNPLATVLGILIPEALPTASTNHSSVRLTPLTLIVRKKTDAVNLLVPNYNRGVTLSANGTTYTVGSGNLASYSCGWVLFENYATSAIDNAVSDWYINNVIVGQQTAGTPQEWTDFNTGIYFVNKGDTFKNVGKAGRNKLTFFPCKGF